MGHYGDPALSALAASTGRGGVRSWSGAESRGAGRDAGMRAASVQQVVAELKEHSSSRSGAAEAEDVPAGPATQPESSTMAMSGDGVMVVSGGAMARRLQMNLPHMKEKRQSQRDPDQERERRPDQAEGEGEMPGTHAGLRESGCSRA